jgi:protein MAK11
MNEFCGGSKWWSRKKNRHLPVQVMAPLAPNKKRKVAFEDETTKSEPVKVPKGKKRKQQPLKKSSKAEEPSSSNGKALTPENLGFKVIAGSYEKILYGLEGRYDKETGKADLKPTFIFPAHLSCIKAVAASPGGKWLATGAADEVIKVWDLRRRKEVGGLVQHEGIVHLSTCWKLLKQFLRVHHSALLSDPLAHVLSV